MAANKSEKVIVVGGGVMSTAIAMGTVPLNVSYFSYFQYD